MAEMQFDTDAPQLVRDGVPMFSRDGVPIPESGVTFVLTRTNPETDSEEVTKIVLRDVLCGLGLKTQANGKRAKAITFASQAIQLGFRTEEEILRKHGNLLNPRIVGARRLMEDDTFDFSDEGKILDEDGQQVKAWTNSAGEISRQWFSKISAARNSKASATMKANNVEITEGQRMELFRLQLELEERELRKMADRLLDLIQCDEEEEGPMGWKASTEIGKARATIESFDRARDRRNRPQGNSGNSDTPAAPVVPEDEPF